MGLKSVFQNAAKTIFTAFDDIPISVTYVSKGDSTYNVATGVAVPSSETEYTVDGILEDYTAVEIDDITILSTDQKFLIPQLNLSPTPREQDEIVIDSITWQVIDIETDPAEALWIMQIRKP
jgi:hypothetical protein